MVSPMPKGAHAVERWGTDIPAAWFVRPDGFDASGTIHGVAHTLRVLIHACELSDALDRVRLGDLDVMMLRHEVSRTRVERAHQLLREIR
jgi:hypothetical protein